MKPSGWLPHVPRQQPGHSRIRIHPWCSHVVSSMNVRSLNDPGFISIVTVQPIYQENPFGVFCFNVILDVCVKSDMSKMLSCHDWNINRHMILSCSPTNIWFRKIPPSPQMITDMSVPTLLWLRGMGGGGTLGWVHCHCGASVIFNAEMDHCTLGQATDSQGTQHES